MKISRLKVVFAMLLLLKSIMAPAQCISGPLAFKPGEKIFYEVSYNWGILWVNAGEVYFSADTITYNGKKHFYFDSFGQSYKFYDWIYKVRDRFQSKVDHVSFQPVWFAQNTYEGGYEVNINYIFDFRSSRVISTAEHTGKPLTIDTLPLQACTFDVITAVYYARCIDYSVYEPGDKIPIRFIIDGEFYDLYLRFLGREIKKNRDGEAYRCIKFSALLVEGTIFKGGEDLVVWVTDDENKIPVMVEAKILVGSIKAYLTGYEGLKSELKVVVD